MRKFLWSFATIGIAAVSVQGRSQPGPAPSAPLEPITAVIEAFHTNNVVALGEGTHGNEQGHRFRLALIRDPRFAETVNDIVVEFGNSLYQPLMDRFIANGDVPADDLRKVWQNTTAAHYPWEPPIYEEFFGAVRAVNAALPANRRVRVLLGDPPIDWSKIRNQADAEPWGEQRETYPAGLIRDQVLAKRRRALVVYGDGHFFRHSPYGSIVIAIERAHATSLTIAAVTDMDLDRAQASVSAWPRPSLSMLRGTMLGSATVTDVMPLYRQDWLGRMEDQFDALLYLGPRASITYSRFPTTLCGDSSYLRMRFERMALFPVLSNEIARLKRICQLPG